MIIAAQAAELTAPASSALLRVPRLASMQISQPMAIDAEYRLARRHTFGGTRKAEDPRDRPGRPSGRKPKDGLLAIPPHEHELGAGRADPDGRGELEAKRRLGGCQSGVCFVSRALD